MDNEKSMTYKESDIEMILNIHYNRAISYAKLGRLYIEQRKSKDKIRENLQKAMDDISIVIENTKDNETKANALYLKGTLFAVNAELCEK